MTSFDRITEGDRERELLAKLREGKVTPENVEEHCLPFFVKIQIQTDSRCNARCLTCPYPVTRQKLPQGRMEEALYHEIVDQIQGRGVERTSLFLMNEPLVDPRIEKFTKYLKEKDPQTNVLIFTNGYLLNGERASALSDAGVDEIDISVNGFDEESHNRVMHGISYQKVMANLLELGTLIRNRKLPNTTIKVVGLSLPGNEEGAKRLQQETGIEVYLKPVTNRAGLIDTTQLGGGKEKSESMTLCQRPFVKAYVLYNGDMVLCNCDWMRTTIIGNVKDTSLEDLWLGPAMMEVRRSHLRGDFPKGLPCVDCDYPYLI
ncbi:MAG: radical SAM/SPASM domain-containing protein [Planctomycetota bacterium]